MSSPSNSPRRSQSPDNQPSPPRLQREDATVDAPGAPADLDEDRLAAIANRVLDSFDPNDFFGSMATAFERMRNASRGNPDTFRAIGRHAIAEIYRRRNPEDGILDPAPPYKALPMEGEVTVELAVVEPEYTPPPPPYTRYPRGQKRKREGDDNGEDGEGGEAGEEEQNHAERDNEGDNEGENDSE